MEATTKRLSQVPKGQKSGWFQPDPKPPVDNKNKEDTDGAAPTQLDSQMSDNEGKGKDAEAAAAAAGKRQTIVGSGTSPEKKRVKTSLDKESRVRSIPGLEEHEIIDLGGTGECGWLALAAGMAQINKKPLSNLSNVINKLGPSLHARVINYMKHENTAWKAAWAIDPSTNETMEGGQVAGNLAEYLEVLGRYRRWVCGNVLVHAAKHLKIVIVIFEVRDGRWVRTCVLNEGGGKNIVPLLLHNDHFVTLKRPEKGFPKPWGIVSGQEKSWTGRAAGPKSSSSGLKRRSDACSLNSWIQPDKSASAPKTLNRRTPSSQTGDSWIRPASSKGHATSQVHTDKQSVLKHTLKNPKDSKLKSFTSGICL